MPTIGNVPVFGRSCSVAFYAASSVTTAFFALARLFADAVDFFAVRAVAFLRVEIADFFALAMFKLDL
jgi:hypothetical protein